MLAQTLRACKGGTTRGGNECSGTLVDDFSPGVTFGLTARRVRRRSLWTASVGPCSQDASTVGWKEAAANVEGEKGAGGG